MRWVAALLLLVPAAPAGAAQPLLVGLVPQVPDGGGDAVAVASPTDWDLAGHWLTDGEDAWPFPALHLAAGEPLWVVSNASAWAAHQGPGPAVAMDPPLRLGDGGDDVRLVAPDGRVLDEAKYGAKDATGLLPGASPGLVFLRDAQGGSWVDTDGPADWATPRLHRLGESALDQPTFTAQAVTLYSSPDSSFEVLAGLVRGARERLHLHVYELRSAELADLLVAARIAHPGLDLQVLVDANPVGAGDRDRHATADALRRIQAVGGRAVLAGNGRYDDHHLKVLVADGAVAVQSENWVPSGVPADPTWGNRGLGVVLHDPAAADWFATWLAGDRAAWDARPFDLTAYDPGFEPPPRRAPRTGDYGPRVPPLRLDGPVEVVPLVSPDHTQDPRSDPVAALVDGAGRRVLAEQLDLARHARNGLGWSSDDPWLAALGHAAARGLEVQVLAAAPFSAEDDGNAAELAWLADRGADAAVLDRPGLATLHAKAFVIDDALVVGSTNGNHHSRSANREVAVVLRSAAAADWGAALFAGDADPPTPGRDWGVPGEDLHALPAAPWPTLLALLGVGRILRVRRCR